MQLDAVVGTGETIRERAASVLWLADRFLRECCDGRLSDVTVIRHHVRGDLLPDAEFEVGAACRERFDPPELPATTMVGVSNAVGGDNPVKIETEARIPHDRSDHEVIELPPAPGYVSSADRDE